MELYMKLVEYLQYPFVVYAIIVGTLIALCASLVGVTLVLKRFSYIGSGLSNIAFVAIIIASIFDIAYEMPFVLLITIICTILILKNGANIKVQGDAMIAMVSVGALAIGYLLINIFPTSSNIAADVCATLFGATSILTLSIKEVWFSITLSILVVVSYVIFYNKIFAITFDEEFSIATGSKTSKYNLLISIITATIIVLAMQLVGSLLITALVVFPAISAIQVFKSFKSVVICSAILATISAIVGIVISILAGTPVGSTIVVVEIVGYILFMIVGRLKR